VGRTYEGLDRAVKPPDVGNESGQVLCDERLGGLLKHYYR
jgi:hypothetical protein